MNAEGAALKLRPRRRRVPGPRSASQASQLNRITPSVVEPDRSCDAASSVVAIRHDFGSARDPHSQARYPRELHPERLGRSEGGKAEPAVPVLCPAVGRVLCREACGSVRPMFLRASAWRRRSFRDFPHAVAALPRIARRFSPPAPGRVALRTLGLPATLSPSRQKTRGEGESP